MSTNGTPFEGRDNIIATRVYTGLEMRLYTNTSNSLTDASVLADLTYPSGTGYAHQSIADSWSSSNGVVTHPTNVQFENTGGTNWTGDVTGAALTDGTYILHFKDLTLGTVTMTPGDILEIDLSSFISV